MVTDSFPPLATAMTPGRTDSNHARPPSFFTTASAPSMSVVCPPETCEPCTCPLFLPRPMFPFFRAKAEWGRLPGPQERPAPPADLASEGRAGAGPPVGLLPGLRPAQGPGGLVPPSRPGEQRRHGAGRMRPHPEDGCRRADGRRPDGALALCGPPGSGPSHPAGAPGTDPAPAPAAASGHRPDVVPTPGVETSETRTFSTVRLPNCGSWGRCGPTAHHSVSWRPEPFPCPRSP